MQTHSAERELGKYKNDSDDKVNMQHAPLRKDWGGLWQAIRREARLGNYAKHRDAQATLGNYVVTKQRYEYICETAGVVTMQHTVVYLIYL